MEFCEQADWIDVWRTLHPDKFEYTWKRTNPLVMSRLDYFLVPQSMIGIIENCEIKSNIFSDHLFLEMTIETNEQIRGKGYWKFNTSLLEDKEYIDSANQIIAGACKKFASLDPGTKWDSMKQEISEHAKFWGRLKAAKVSRRKQELLKKLNTHEKKLACINLKSSKAVQVITKTNDKIDLVKTELQRISQKQIVGVMIRSKARFYELGEKNTKYFFNLEKSKAKNSVMKVIITDQDKMVIKPKQILEEQRSFYEKLYTKDPQVKFKMDIASPRVISQIDKQSLESTLPSRNLLWQ